MAEVDRRAQFAQARTSVVAASSPRLFVSLPKSIHKRGASDGPIGKKAPSARMLGGPSLRHLGCDDNDAATVEGSVESSIQSQDTMKSCPRLFVNPPAFAIDDGNSAKPISRRHTIGVPMLGFAGYLSGKSKRKSKTAGKVVASAKPSAAAPRMCVNPPSYTAANGGSRRTLGVPMV